MPLNTAQITVGTAAVLVLGPQDNPTKMILHNAEKSSNEFIWFGGSSAVTTLTGAHLDNASTYELTLNTGNELWAIADKAGKKLHVIWQVQ
jgi:hypothetical protein